MSDFKSFAIGLKEGFVSFGYLITNVINFVLLFFVYFVGIGLTSIFAKIFGKHFLDLGSKDKKTYWVDHKVTKQKMGAYYRTF